MSLKAETARVKSSPPKRLSLRANFSWTAIGNIVYAACQWGVITVLAKLGTPEMVGKFALALAIATPVIQFSNLQLRAIQATDARDEHEFQDYLSLRALSTFGAFLVCVVIALLSQSQFEAILAIVLVSIAKGVDAISDVFYGRLQKMEQMDIISKALVINGGLSLTLFGSLLYLDHSLTVALLGYVAGSAFSLVTYVLPKAQTYGFQDRHTKMSQSRVRGVASLARLALPMGIVMLLVSINSNIPRYLIEGFLGSESLGIYSALAYLLIAGSTVVNAMSQAVSPRLAKEFQLPNHGQFMRILLRLLGLVIGGGLLMLAGFLVFGEQALRVVYTDEYAEHARLLLPLAIGGTATFAAGVLGTGVTAMRSFVVQTRIQFASLLITLPTGVILVDSLGLYGIAWLTLVNGAVLLVGYGWVTCKNLRAAGED